MNVTLIIWGLLFFVNPNIAIIDPLPDFIGALMICAGIYRFSRTDENAADALKGFRNLFIISLLHAISGVLVFVIDESETTWYLVLALVFGIIEAPLFAYSFLKLTKAITYRAMRADTPELYDCFTAQNSTTVAFTVFRVVMSIIPELVFLVTDYGEVTVGGINWDFLFRALMAVNIISVLIFGVIWFVGIRKRFMLVKKCENFNSYIGKRYTEDYLGSVSLAVYDRAKIVCALLTASVIFTAPMTLSGIDFLPDFVSGILMIIALFILESIYKKSTRIPLIVSGAYTVTALAEWIWSLIFTLNNTDVLDSATGYSEMLLSAFLHDPGVYTEHIFLTVTSGIKFALFCAALFFTISPVLRIVRDHVGCAPEVHSDLARRKTELLQRSLRRMSRVLFFSSMLLALTDTVSRAFTVELPWLWAFDITIGIAVAVTATVFFSRIRSGIANKYFLY